MGDEVKVLDERVERLVKVLARLLRVEEGFASLSFLEIFSVILICKEENLEACFMKS